MDGLLGFGLRWDVLRIVRGTELKQSVYVEDTREEEASREDVED